MFNFTAIARRYRSFQRHIRESRMIAQAIKSHFHPILVHLIPMRRCNLACTYCNEFDNFSAPVPTSELLHRIDLLSRLGSANIHLSGGEPLLHPDIIKIIKYIHDSGILSGLLTNGYLLTKGLICDLNNAGLDYLQISVDNVSPDESSMKSLKVLDKKLQWLAEYAEFEVSINSVIGFSVKDPKDAVQVSRRVAELGLKSTVGIIHDHEGQLQPLNEETQRAYEEAVSVRGKSFANVAYYNQFQKNLIHGLPNQWHCRAGSRYLYVCEDGLVHYCSQQRGYPGIPLEKYTIKDLERENKAVKSCAPYCTISCVHRVASIDHVRERPFEALNNFFPPGEVSMPAIVRLLKWTFLSPNPGFHQRALKRAARKFFRVA
ncbi:MAG TPA: radical SAM protein [Acidobacteriota bacterium]|nr:radical SAM protein [Acidobacteriota bacterium]